jgi:hypothetical protein
MALMAAGQTISDANTTVPVSVLVKQPGSAVAEMLDRGLRGAGVWVVLVPTVYDVVAEAERASAVVDHIVVGVDHFGPGEFRLIPLVRREWPETVVVAYHAPGFEHKGRIAELVGADIVLSTAADASRFLATVALPRAAQPVAATPPAPPREPPSPAPPAPAAAAGPAEPAPAAAPTPPPPASEAAPEASRGPAPLIQPRRPPPLAAAFSSPPPAPAAATEPAGPPSDAAPPLPAREPATPRAPAPPTPPAIESYLAGATTTDNAPEPRHEPQPQTETPPDEARNRDGDRRIEQYNGGRAVHLTDDELRVLLGEEGDT